MPVIVKYDTRTVHIYSRTEAERESKETDGKTKIYSVRAWKEVVGQGATLSVDDMKSLITTLVEQGNGDGIVRVNCDHGVHRSASAAILFLWSQLETVSLEAVYNKVDLAYQTAGLQPSGMIKKTLLNSLGPLLTPGGKPIRRRGGVTWEEVKNEQYATRIKGDLFGV